LSASAPAASSTASFLIKTSRHWSITHPILPFYRKLAGRGRCLSPAAAEAFTNPDTMPRWEARRILFAIADMEGSIVFGGRKEDLGKRIPATDLNKGEKLVVDGKQVAGCYLPRRWTSGDPARGGRLPRQCEPGYPVQRYRRRVGGSGLGGILAFTLTRSLRELTAATQALAKGELGHQVRVRSQDELGALAVSFNRMSSELQRSNDLRRRMTADIAHDLRTPLSVILGYTEALSDGKLEAPARFTR